MLNKNQYFPQIHATIELNRVLNIYTRNLKIKGFFMYGFTVDSDGSNQYTSANYSYYLGVKIKKDNEDDNDKIYSSKTSDTFNVWDNSGKKYYANETNQGKYTIWNAFDDENCTQKIG